MASLKSLILLKSYDILCEITVLADLDDIFLSKLQLQFQQRYSDLSCRKLETMWYCTFHLSNCQRKYYVREFKYYTEKICVFFAYVIYLFPLLLYHYNYSINPFIIQFSVLSRVCIYLEKFVMLLFITRASCNKINEKISEEL